jgi:MFS family permease
MARVLGEERGSAPAALFAPGFFGPGGDDESTGALRPMGAFVPPEAGAAPPAVPPPSAAPVPERRGLLARLTAPFRILSDAKRNREFWKFLLGQGLLSLGVNFHYTALPDLVAAKPENSGRVSLNRTVNWTAQGLAGLTTGPLVDRTPTSGMLVWTYLGRSLLLMSVPILFFNGYFGFAVFQLVIFGAGFLQSMGGTAASVAFARILGSDEKAYNRANAVYNLVLYLAGVVGPLVAGSFIAALNTRFGFLSGNALAYGVYALFLLAVAVLYRLFLRLPRDEVMLARRSLADRLRKGPGRHPRVRGVAVEHVAGEPRLVVELSGDASDASGIPAEHEGFPVRAAAAPRPIAQVLEGFRLNWSDPFLRRTMLFSIPEALAGEALVFGALPRYIQDVMTLPDASWIAALPLIGPFFAGLATRAGAFGLYLAVSSLGLGLASFATMFLRSEVRPGDPRAGYWGRLDTLEKQSLVTSILFGLGSLAYLGVFFVPNLWASAAMMLLSSILQAPAQTVWGSVHQRVLQERFSDRMGNVLSARGFYFTVLSIAGLLLFGWMLTAWSTPAVMLAVGIGMAVIAATHVLEPFFVFPLGPKKG